MKHIPYIKINILQRSGYNTLKYSVFLNFTMKHIFHFTTKHIQYVKIQYISSFYNEAYIIY